MMKLEDFKVYRLSMVLADSIWDKVISWGKFDRDTLGKQLIRSADSISANLSEGFGRYHFKEARHFSYYARGSLFETKTWLEKAKNRRMISLSEYQNYDNQMELLGKMLNAYIHSIGPSSQK